MLFTTPSLEEKEQEVVEKIQGFRQQLAIHTRKARRWRGLLRRNALAKAIRGSNSIEGYNVSVEDAVAAAEGEDPLDADKETWAAITGYRNAMTYVLQLADEPELKYSIDLLKSLHFMMIGHDLGRHPGRWRPGPIYVREEPSGEIVYEGPPSDVVADLMSELVVALNREDRNSPAIVRAGMAHLNLVMVHPFSDGNGRMARVLQSLVLAREGILEAPFCSIEEYLGQNTQAYYAVLATVGGGRWQPERDARPWMRFVLTAHYRQAVTLLNRTKEMEALCGLIEDEIRRRELPERALFALVDAANRWKVRNATYRSVAEVSEVVASRDLKLLADRQLLVPQGEKRGRFYLASDYLRSLADRVRLPHQIPDPFTLAA